MENKLIEQYKAIKETIQCNIETIKQLLKQAEQLRTIVEKISNNWNNEPKKNLEITIWNIENSISELIKHTNDLFEKYEWLMRITFK